MKNFDSQLNFKFFCLHSDTLYTIINFGKAKTGKQDVKLIPVTWLYYENNWFCYYPSAKDYPNVNEWCQSFKPPNIHQKSYHVTIISESSKFYWRLKTFILHVQYPQNVCEHTFETYLESKVMKLCKLIIKNQFQIEVQKTETIIFATFKLKLIFDQLLMQII